MSMLERTGQRVQLPSDGKQSDRSKAKKENQEIADNGWQKESPPKESPAVSNTTSTRR